MSVSTYLANKVLDHSLGTQAWTMPSAVYIGLYTGESGSELSGSGYSRIELPFAAADDGEAVNSTTEDFPEATDNWQQFSHFRLFDAATDGNELYRGALAETKTVLQGQQFRIRPGDITVTAE